MPKHWTVGSKSMQKSTEKVSAWPNHPFLIPHHRLWIWRVTDWAWRRGAAVDCNPSVACGSWIKRPQQHCNNTDLSCKNKGGSPGEYSGAALCTYGHISLLTSGSFIIWTYADEIETLPMIPERTDLCSLPKFSKKEQFFALRINRATHSTAVMVCQRSCCPQTPEFTQPLNANVI